MAHYARLVGLERSPSETPRWHLLKVERLRGACGPGQSARRIRETRRSVALMKQNITLSVDTDLLRSARVLAAERGVSVSKLLAEELERLVRDNQARQRARQQAM